MILWSNTLTKAVWQGPCELKWFVIIDNISKEKFPLNNTWESDILKNKLRRLELPL